VCQTLLDSALVPLGIPNRIWAISAIHADASRLAALHDALYPRIAAGDRIVYLGNYVGHGLKTRETLDELLSFRRSVLALPSVIARDVIYLRGQQEEMWQKLLQLQFAPNPLPVLLWMLQNGLSETLCAWGQDPSDAIMAAQEGTMGLTRWTGRLREFFRRVPGHDLFMNHLGRAAYTTERAGAPLLFVHAGIDPSKPLARQGDSFWWAGAQFSAVDQPFKPFRKVVRGYDPAHNGMRLNCVTATLDGGCGFGGSLVCAGFDKGGEVFEILEV
jgi:hypothetical protein